MAHHGMVATSQPLAAQAGLQILMRGGNAIDAAVATAAVLSLVEPMSVGIASDLFAVIYIVKEHKLYVLNSSGMAPTGATVERFNQLGYHWNPKNWGPTSGMPPYGILVVTVPGTVWGWEAVLKRFGKLSFQEVLDPAAQYAEEGFSISERIAHDWRLPDALPLQECCQQKDPDSVKTWYVNGRSPEAGQVFRNPDLARTLRLLQKGGADAFYRGEIARAIVAKSDALGGTMTLQDLASYKGEWVEPAASTYHGFDIFELPPPSQAWSTNEMLNILEACVPRWVPGQSLASLGPANAKFLASDGGSEKARLRRPVQVQRRPRLQFRPRGQAAFEILCSVAVRQGRPRASFDAGPEWQHRSGRRHDRSVCGRRRGQHGFVGEQQLQLVRVGDHGARIRLPAAQPRRAVHAGSGQPQRDRPAQAPLQHSVGRVRDARWATLDDHYPDGRRHAGPRSCAGTGEYSRPRRESASRGRHGALPPQSGSERIEHGVAAV